MQRLVRTASWFRGGYVLPAVFSHGTERGHLSSPVRAPSHHEAKVPPPNAIILGARVSTRESWRGGGGTQIFRPELQLKLGGL